MPEEINNDFKQLLNILESSGSHYNIEKITKAYEYACQMHDLIFPQFADKTLGDITKIDWQQVKSNVGGARNRPFYLFLTLSGYIASRQADGFEGRLRYPLGITLASSRCRRSIAA